VRATRRAVLLAFNAVLPLAAAACGGPLLAMPAPPASPPPTASIRAERVDVVPVGTLRQSDAAGTVQRVIDHRRLLVDTEFGALMIPIGESCSEAFDAGRRVRVLTAAQQVALVERPAGGVETPSPLATRLVADTPSTYSTVIGDVLAVAGDGRLTVEAPGGPVTLWVPPAAWQLGGPVQVWTWVDPGRECRPGR
jgi:hypothetical protein